MTVTIKPTNSALSVLKSLHALRVLVTVTFRPREGASFRTTDVVTVHYYPVRHSQGKH
jgi:hypothetical protein